MLELHSFIHSHRQNCTVLPTGAPVIGWNHTACTLFTHIAGKVHALLFCSTLHGGCSRQVSVPLRINDIAVHQPAFLQLHCEPSFSARSQIICLCKGPSSVCLNWGGCVYLRTAVLYVTWPNTHINPKGSFTLTNQFICPCEGLFLTPWDAQVIHAVARQRHRPHAFSAHSCGS